MGPKSLIKIIHSSVKGRRRFRVKGLPKSAPMKSWIEHYLSRDDKVKDVSANPATGNVLVTFDPECNPKRISTLLEQVTWAFIRSASEYTDKEIINRVEEKLRETGLLVISEQSTKRKWYLEDTDNILDQLGSSPEGLTTAAIQTNLTKYGKNIIPEPEERSKVDIFLSQFQSFPILVLGVATGVSLATGGVVDAVVIGSVIVANSIIGYITESEAEKTMNSLKSLINPSAAVMREGAVISIPTQDVLVGDILLLKPGTYVSADARVIDASNLTVDESILTGESLPVDKFPDIIDTLDTPLSSRNNMIFAGTIITGGQGTAVVVAVGTYTELGKIQSLVAGTETQDTLIESQLALIGNHLIVISGAVCGIIFAIGIFRGIGFYQMLRTTISLAVAAVPEGLPAIATATLAIGVQKLRQQRVLVRNLDAVCTMGAVQTVCLDKTGTITLNRMTAIRVFTGMKSVNVDNGCTPFPDSKTCADILDCEDEMLQLLMVAVLCNETEVNGEQTRYTLNGSSTENALVFLAIKYGLDVDAVRQDYPLLKTQYRSEDNPYMITTHTLPKGKLLALKGSPPEVLEKCRYHVVNGERRLLSEVDKESILNENSGMADDPLRVLGVAMATRRAGKMGVSEGYTWLGLVGMTDPIRKGVAASIKELHRAGIDTVMITGDQYETAEAVGKTLNLGKNGHVTVLDASDFDGPETMEMLVKDTNVFSRVSPSDKLQIVQALQGAGRIIAMTGDGINDSPALKAADIGISMGKSGTDVAREVADVILQDDELQTLIIAIRDGRAVHDNIRKALRYMLATNFSEILLMLTAGTLGIGYPLAAMQLLWINLVSDTFPGLALAMEPPETDIMSRPPRDPEAPLVSRKEFKRLAFEGTVMSTAALASYGYGLIQYGAGATANTLAFQTLTSAQILHALSSRSESGTVLDKHKDNPYLSWAVLGSLGLQTLTQLVPSLRSFLGLTPLSLTDLLIVGGTTLSSLLLNEVTKPPSDVVEMKPRCINGSIVYEKGA